MRKSPIAWLQSFPPNISYAMAAPAPFTSSEDCPLAALLAYCSECDGDVLAFAGALDTPRLVGLATALQRRAETDTPFLHAVVGDPANRVKLLAKVALLHAAEPSADNVVAVCIMLVYIVSCTPGGALALFHTRMPEDVLLHGDGEPEQPAVVFAEQQALLLPRLAYAVRHALGRDVPTNGLLASLRFSSVVLAIAATLEELVSTAHLPPPGRGVSSAAPATAGADGTVGANTNAAAGTALAASSPALGGGEGVAIATPTAASPEAGVASVPAAGAPAACAPSAGAPTASNAQEGAADGSLARNRLILALRSFLLSSHTLGTLVTSAAVYADRPGYNSGLRCDTRGVVASDPLSGPCAYAESSHALVSLTLACSRADPLHVLHVVDGGFASALSPEDSDACLPAPLHVARACVRGLATVAFTPAAAAVLCMTARDAVAALPGSLDGLAFSAGIAHPHKSLRLVGPECYFYAQPHGLSSSARGGTPIGSPPSQRRLAVLIFLAAVNATHAVLAELLGSSWISMIAGSAMDRCDALLLATSSAGAGGAGSSLGGNTPHQAPPQPQAWSASMAHGALAEHALCLASNLLASHSLRTALGVGLGIGVGANGATPPLPHGGGLATISRSLVRAALSVLLRHGCVPRTSPRFHELAAGAALHALYAPVVGVSQAVAPLAALFFDEGGAGVLGALFAAHATERASLPLLERAAKTLSDLILHPAAVRASPGTMAWVLRCVAAAVRGCCAGEAPSEATVATFSVLAARAANVPPDAWSAFPLPQLAVGLAGSGSTAVPGAEPQPSPGLPWWWGQGNSAPEGDCPTSWHAAAHELLVAIEESSEGGEQ